MIYVERKITEKSQKAIESLQKEKMKNGSYNTGSTPQKQMEARILKRILRKELSKFKEYVREYQERG